MALYLGNDKIKINLNGAVYHMNLFSATPTTNSIGLLSSDNYILTDINGVYILPSDYISPVVGKILLSSDNCILQDSNGVYLTY